jgi:hypothetical protein
MSAVAVGAAPAAPPIAAEKIMRLSRVLAHAAIEIGEIPVELLERKAEREDLLDIGGREACRQAVAPKRVKCGRESGQGNRIWNLSD